MEKYIEKFENRIPACLEVPWIKENILEMLGGNASSMDVYRWRSAIYYPPVDMLIKLSEITRQPTAYLIGQTDVLKEVGSEKGEPLDIKSYMESRNIKVSDLASKAGTTNATMRDLLGKFPNIRTNSLIAIAEALDVSTDFLLGLSRYPRWEDAKPFMNVVPGEPAYVKRDDEEDGFYCILGFDGKTVYTADGKSADKDSFAGARIMPVANKNR